MTASPIKPPIKPRILPRILTGDTPTGRLHLGHWVGSVKRRVELQSTHDCFFILANMHAFTTRADKPAEIRQDCLEIVRDYLAMGIDPRMSTIFLQSEIPAIAELTFLFAMLLPFNRVMRNPTLKTEIEQKELGDTYSFGFPLYAVGQTADILAFRPHGVPVGEDQVPHLELTREVARRFNQLYCGVSDKADDSAHATPVGVPVHSGGQPGGMGNGSALPVSSHGQAQSSLPMPPLKSLIGVGGVFPIPKADVGKVGRLVGIDGTNKMSKSLGNAIFISDPPEEVVKKVKKIFTGRQSPTEPGDPRNALFQFVDCFLPDENRIAELKDNYSRGNNLGDGHVKAELADAINALLSPMRERRKQYEGDDAAILSILKEGTARAIAASEETLALAKAAIKMDFGLKRAVTYV